MILSELAAAGTAWKCALEYVLTQIYRLIKLNSESCCYNPPQFFTSLRSTFQKQKLYLQAFHRGQKQATQLHPFGKLSPRRSEVGGLILTGYLLLALVVRITTTFL